MKQTTDEAARDDIIAESDKRLAAPPQLNPPQPLIHSLPIDQEIEGRIAECRIILQAMSEGAARVLAFAAPGGFGKTALLTRLVQILAPAGTILERVILLNSTTIEPNVQALLEVDCRGGVMMSVLFQQAGRLIGQERAFAELYNKPEEELPLAVKLHSLFEQVSAGGGQRVWFVLDNFETLMASDGSVMDAEWRAFFKGIVAGNHGARVLIAARDIPKLADDERRQFLELKDIANALYQGLPPAECVSYLRKNDAHQGLRGSDAEVDAVLTGFAQRVHWMPMALEWAIGYLEDVRESGETLQTLLAQGERFFSEFDQQQMADGLKRLHDEQLRQQPPEALGVLRLLAFFNRATPKGALARLQDKTALNRVLASLVRRKLVTRKVTSDPCTLYLNDPLAVNLYSLHPIICENEFFKRLDDPQSLYETTARACWGKAYAANEVKGFAYALALCECAEALCAHLTMKCERTDLSNSYAAMLMSKGVVLTSLTRLAEAIVEYNKAIAIRERLVNEEGLTHLANDLAKVYRNKGSALFSLTRLAEAIAEYDKAIAIQERLVNEEGQAHLGNDLAKAYGNKALALEHQQEWDAAFACHDEALRIWSVCIAQKSYWLMQSLLKLLNNRLGTRLRLRRWREAAADVEAVIEHVGSFIEDTCIHDGHKQNAAKEKEWMLDNLRALDADGRERLYAELGERAEAVRQLVEGDGK